MDPLSQSSCYQAINSSFVAPIRLPRRIWNASKRKQRLATRVQRSSTGILINQSLKRRPVPYSGFRTRSASERFQFGDLGLKNWREKDPSRLFYPKK